MNAPATVFFLTGVVLLCTHLRYQIPYYRAVSRLEGALRQQGIKWSFWRDWRLRLRLRSDPLALFSATDTEGIRALKAEIVERHNAIRRSFPRLLTIMLVGLAFCIVAGLIQSILHYVLQ